MSWRAKIKKELYVYCDGACSGNPGPASYAFIVTYGDGQTLEQGARFIGHATNFAAEYEAIVQALLSIVQSNYYRGEVVNVYNDSEVVVKQLQGKFKVNAEHLQLKLKFCKHLENELSGEVKYQWLKRDHRMIKEVDRMARKVMRVEEDG